MVKKVVDRKRYSIFNLYSKNLSFYSNLVDCYVCPICLSVFRRDNINKLTLEHSIPKKLGGKEIILTCKKCNNNFGSKYISRFVDYLSILDINKGLSEKPLRATFSVENVQINTNFIFNKDKYTFIVSDKNNDPKKQEMIKSFFSEGNVETIKTNIDLGPSDEFLRLSLLYCAHLLLFSHFGYFYLLNSSGQFIRNLLINENCKHFLCNKFDLSENNDVRSLINEKVYILLCNSPESLNGYVVSLIPLSTEYSDYIYGLLLPMFPELDIDDSNHKIGENIKLSSRKIIYDKEFLKKEIRVPRVSFFFEK